MRTFPYRYTAYHKEHLTWGECSHNWVDPTEPPIARARYSPVVGPGRREMKDGVTYVCTNCHKSLTLPLKRQEDR
jgi:hypothetical protein